MEQLTQIYQELSAPVDYPCDLSEEAQEVWMERAALSAELAGIIFLAANGGTAPESKGLRSLKKRALALGFGEESPELRGIAALHSPHGH